MKGSCRTGTFRARFETVRPSSAGTIGSAVATPAPSRHDGSHDDFARPISGIVESDREIHRGDCEMLWADLIEGRRSWQDTSQRAEALLATAQVPNPIVNSGLLSLYYLGQDGVPRDPESQTVRREAWRQALREQDADRDGWYRRHYSSMVHAHGVRFGRDPAASFGSKLVHSGLLATADLDAVLAQLYPI